MTASTRTPHRLRVGAVAIAAAVAMAGCSGGTTNTPATATASPSTGAATSDMPGPNTSAAPSVAPGTGTATGENSYVVLGDSYSAGVGSGGSIGSCYRSPNGYGPLVAARYKLDLSYQACGGATIDDVMTKQLNTLSATTSRISITVGGNDVGFGFVLFVCGAPSWLSDCGATIESARTSLRTKLPGQLNALFARIRQRAPKAKVSVLGYPHLFGDPGCNALTFFSDSDRNVLDDATDGLDSVLQKTAAAYGFGFLDPRPSFEAHSPCTSQPWINGLAMPFGDSYHPPSPGQQGFAALVGPALNPTSAVTPSKVTARASKPSVRSVATAVLLMQLDQPTQLKAAQAVGVPVASVKKFVRDLRSSDPSVIATGLAGLRALDRSYTARTTK